MQQQQYILVLCNQEKLHKYTGWARDAVNSIIKDLQTVNLKLESRAH